jgi:hypothetical protein
MLSDVLSGYFDGENSEEANESGDSQELLQNDDGATVGE